ncbi:hypothetical protein Pmani_009331 [Petrolisthes manimaculis]|uniref:Uncharacterized protein n=1 Tax=Petrolisthes manimaculis TaxID=1843537 RepID=A0AAE1UI10_9EUCA|nr:hypothetical protein Pmani_009331 [Petrolisthes manimaculis]
MPRYAYQKPRARVYSYNFGYMNNYYKPMTHYLDHKQRESSEQPGHLSLAERLKTFPMDGSVYRDRATSAPPQGRHHDAPPNNPAEKPHEKMLSIEAPPTTTPTPTPSLCGGSVVDPTSSRNTPMRLTLKEELRRLPPVWHRHPWDWDCVWIPPHETTVCPHFGVGSYHQLITKFLRLKPYRYMALDDLILKEVREVEMTPREFHDKMLALKESDMMGARKFDDLLALKDGELMRHSTPRVVYEDDLLALKDSSSLHEKKKESSLSIKQTEKRESSLSFKQTDRSSVEQSNMTLKAIEAK